MTSPNSTPNIGISPTPDQANPRIPRWRPKKKTSTPFATPSFAMIRDTRVKDSTFRVFCALQKFGYKTHSVCVAASTIAAECGKSVNTVRAAIRELTALDLVRVETGAKCMAKRVIHLLYMDDPTVHPHFQDADDQTQEPQRVTKPIEADSRKICAPDLGDIIHEKDVSDVANAPNAEPTPEPDYDAIQAAQIVQAETMIAKIATKRDGKKISNGLISKFADVTTDLLWDQDSHRRHCKVAHEVARGERPPSQVIQALRLTLDALTDPKRSYDPVENPGGFFFGALKELDREAREGPRPKRERDRWIRAEDYDEPF